MKKILKKPSTKTSTSSSTKSVDRILDGINLSSPPSLLRFISNNRYYNLYIHYNLFGELIITKNWGGLFNKRGGAKSEYTLPSNLPSTLKSIINTRLKHGYSLANINNRHINLSEHSC
ncbi:hypothetical protein NOVO_09160 (plasmid) [Rickettsiales bacterium Ac37b]|nr:hypothetical protein NOVO_09160 [Rickettsiales bacterium Ac37b]